MNVSKYGQRAMVCVWLAVLLVAAAPLAWAETKSARSRTQSDAATAELERLARALKENDSPAKYKQLAAFANKRAKSAAGQRAALALAFRDFNAKKLADARRWLEIADRDAVLREYALYWRAQLERSNGNAPAALTLFEKHRAEFPESVMAMQAVTAVAELALADGDAQRALAALDGYDKTPARSDLLLLRARARELAGQQLIAAADYLTIYYQRPLADEAERAGERIQFLLRALDEKFPTVTQPQKLLRAEAIFDAKQWKAARAEYERLLPELNGPARERAELRIATSRLQLKAPTGVLEQLRFEDPETEAERLFTLAQFYRNTRNEGEMLDNVERVAHGYPQSRWAEEALFLAGNYFWVNLDRVRAADFYRRAVDTFPNGKNDAIAQWRAAWNDYLEKSPQAAAEMEEHLRRFISTPFTTDALYWLGRAAERAGNAPRARTFYQKLVDRFPQTYFAAQSRERLRALGAGPLEPADVVNMIPPASAPPSFENEIPAAAAARYERALALRSIAFDASAELELRAAYAQTGSPRLLLEAAKAALDAGRYMPAVSTARQAFPQLEARRWEDVPVEVWRVAFPLAYSDSIYKYANKNELDPMLVAGIIRQETIFQSDAVSHAGAVGLMQVLPSTGRRLARAERVRYARAKLFEPDYNLRLGTVYFRDLIRTMGSAEAALAAYNAGEDRVVAWKASREFAEPAEFIESIPFTETREYVQIVLRNAEIYRRLYGSSNARVATNGRQQ